jgi:hypothetical protein
LRWGVLRGELRGVVEDLIAGAVDRGRAQEQCLVGDIGGSHPGFEGAAARFCLLDGFGVFAGLLGWVGVGSRGTGQVGTLTIIDSPPWDVEEQIAVAAAGQAVVWTVNDDGRSVLRGQKNGTGLDMPAIPDGVVHAVQVPGEGSAAVLLLDTPGRPMEVAVADLGGDQVRHLTDTRPPAAAAVVPELCHYPAHDGTPIPAWLYRPPDGPGPHPVLLYIHGGPESQARPVYNALFQCLLASGIAVMAPTSAAPPGTARPGRNASTATGAASTSPTSKPPRRTCGRSTG